ncbi:hypothetical protein ACFOSV_07250 [Algoriphagus namhaensis]|uniref:Uncharacterized protein n=1 Tax=Algoriphagus namhaensis TaxID=915353 RepID=A0ABV8AQG5_9BACT
MPNRQKTDSVITPELLRIFKIFGLVSIGLVLILSFFNTRRANNTGEDQTFKMMASDRLYFLNVRSLSYEREVRKDAQMTLFRHDKRKKTTNEPSIDLVILMNSLKDEAYIYLEPVNLDWPIRIKAENGPEITLENGNRETHLANAKVLENFLRNEEGLYLFHTDKWVLFWNEPEELSYLNTVFDDYQELVN